MTTEIIPIQVKRHGFTSNVRRIDKIYNSRSIHFKQGNMNLFGQFSNAQVLLSLVLCQIKPILEYVCIKNDLDLYLGLNFKR